MSDFAIFYFCKTNSKDRNTFVNHNFKRYVIYLFKTVPDYFTISNQIVLFWLSNYQFSIGKFVSPIILWFCCVIELPLSSLFVVCYD
jgi:hypothetical protein